MKICSIESCNKKVKSKGLCDKHYMQVRRHGHVGRTRSDPNETMVRNNICEMYLYNIKGKYINSTFFDKKFLSKVQKFKWYCSQAKQTYYVATNIKTENNSKRIFYLHQLILSCELPLMIDHKNGNGLNNRLDNLRIVTNRENCQNTRKNTSGYTGVSWSKQHQKWISAITVNNKYISLGYFDNKKEAFEVYSNYKKEHNLL